MLFIPKNGGFNRFKLTKKTVCEIESSTNFTDIGLQKYWHNGLKMVTLINKKKQKIPRVQTDRRIDGQKNCEFDA
jgi:D-lyxose ketol-isomerase